METDQIAFAAGTAAATADIAAGCLVYRWHGHAGHWGHWIVAQLASRFGVRVNDGFGVCLVTSSSVSFDAGYNATLTAEIDQIHDRGAFGAVFAEARQQSEEALYDAKRAWIEQHVEP